MEKTLGFILKIVINFFIRHENTTVCNTKTMTLILSLFEMKLVYQSIENYILEINEYLKHFNTES